MENVTGQTLGMNSDQRRRGALQIAALEYDGFFDFTLRFSLEPEDAELAEPGGEVGFRNFSKLEGGGGQTVIIANGYANIIETA